MLKCLVNHAPVWTPSFLQYKATTNLNAEVRAEIKVEFAGMRDDGVDAGARRDVLRLADGIARVGHKEASMVALLNHDERNRRPVVGRDILARLAHIHHFLLEDELELALGHAVAVDDDMLRLLLGLLVEVGETLLDGVDEVDDALHALVLDLDGGAVFGGGDVDIADDGGDGGRVFVADAGMRHIDSDEQRRPFFGELAPPKRVTLVFFSPIVGGRDVHSFRHEHAVVHSAHLGVQLERDVLRKWH